MANTFFALLFLVAAIRTQAQPKNYLKINVLDCVNCVKAVDYIVEKDPFVTFVFHSEYAEDLNGVIRKFGLEPFRERILWNGKLYDSLSKDVASEVIQFYDNKEINRSGLKDLHFVETSRSDGSKLCLAALSNHIVFRDYDNFITIFNYAANRRYVYSKKLKLLQEIGADSNTVRSVYLDNFKSPGMYKHYCFEIEQASELSPAIVSVHPQTDSTLIAVMRTYKISIDSQRDTTLSPYYCAVEIDVATKCRKTIFLDEPAGDYLYKSTLFSSKGKYYAPLSLSQKSMEDGVGSYLAVLVRDKNKLRHKGFAPISFAEHDYLRKTKFFQNFNESMISNGYYFMGLSQFALHLETGTKVRLPFPDSIYEGLHKYPGRGINFIVSDFKYNPGDKRMYLLYYLDDSAYAASFVPGQTAFEHQAALFNMQSRFGKNQKCLCLSADGKKIVYMMRDDNCLQFVTTEQLQQTAAAFNAEEAAME